jgi:hypothetical protein
MAKNNVQDCDANAQDDIVPVDLTSLAAVSGGFWGPAAFFSGPPRTPTVWAARVYGNPFNGNPDPLW